jgi:hypothetical protein
MANNVLKGWGLDNIIDFEVYTPDRYLLKNDFNADPHAEAHTETMTKGVGLAEGLAGIFLGPETAAVGPANVAEEASALSLPPAINNQANVSGYLGPSAAWIHDPVFSADPTLYEVGTYNQLRPAAGDGTIIHHVPSRLRGAELIPNYAKTQMAGTEIGIRLPASEADAVDAAALLRSRIPASAREELGWQLKELRNFTNAPNSSLKRAVQLNKDLHPLDFGPEAKGN